ncbi:MAG TPA: ABC transporter ATP-binding protein [Candidatus Tectomicrobia bacterium]
MASITLERTCVDFPIYGVGSRSLKKNLLQVGIGSHIGRGPHNRITVHALRDVSLEFQDGDRVALVGPNGSGKSTLLRTIAGIYEPAHGRVHVYGRITTLFNLNVGMEESGTGFENIALRGLAAGMTRQQIEQCASDIADFTELGEYLNFPIDTYSSGMRARLAFAISTAIEPDILLMDEWIGAGDERFVQKVRDRLNGLVDRAGILVLASHNDNLLKRMCNRFVQLEAGRVKRTGSAETFFSIEKQ